MMIYVTLQGEMCNSCVWHHSDKHEMSDGTEKCADLFFWNQYWVVFSYYILQ